MIIYALAVFNYKLSHYQLKTIKLNPFKLFNTIYLHYLNSKTSVIYSRIQ